MHIVRYGANSLGNYTFTMPTGFSPQVDIYTWGAGGGAGKSGPNTSTGVNIIAGATPQSVTFTSDTTWVVPAGVSSISVILSGAGGGSGGDSSSDATQLQGSSGFSGDRVQGTLNVTPGQIITLSIGTGGINGWRQNALGNTNALGGVGTYPGGMGGALNGSTTGGTGGGGGAASAILVGSTLIAVAGGGGGGGGAGNASIGGGQVTGQSTTASGGNGANTTGTGGSAGGGGGGYPKGGAAGTVIGSYAGAMSGANGQSSVPSGWTLTLYGGSIGTPAIIPESGENSNTGRAVISWSGVTTTTQWATSTGGTGGRGGFGGYASTRATINEGDQVTFAIGGPGINGLNGPSLMQPDYQGGSSPVNSTRGGGGGGATVVLVNGNTVVVAGGGGGGGAGGPNGALGGHGGSARETGTSRTTRGENSADGLYTGGGGGGGYYGGRAGSIISGGEGGTCFGTYVEAGTQFAPGGKSSPFYNGVTTATPGYPGEIVFIFHRRFNIWKKIQTTALDTRYRLQTIASWHAITNIWLNISGEWKSIIQGWIKENNKWIPLLGTGQPNPTASYIASLPAVDLKTTTIVVQPPRIQINLYISANVLNYNLWGALVNTPAYTSTGQGSDITLTILGGVVVGSSSSTSPALNISGLQAGDSLTVINNGAIVGKGGNGGNGGGNYYNYGGWYNYGYYNYTWAWSWGSNSAIGWYGYGGWNNYYAPSVGGAGGPAIATTSKLKLQNNGTIGGGGGGGGGGAHYGGWRGYYYSWYGDWYSGNGGGGGGGGAGYTSGTPGTGGVGSNRYGSYYHIWWGYYEAYTPGGSGATGGTFTGGAGGTGSQVGGAGGGLGNPGAASGAAGGAAGAAILGNANVSYLAVGDIRGART